MCLWSRFLSARTYFVFSIFLFLLFTTMVPRIFASSIDDALMNISEAEEILGVTYEAVLEAEQVGADVSSLLSQMSLGAEYLAEANFRYRVGAYEDATRFASLCIETVDGVRGNAAELNRDSKMSNETDFFLRLFWSSVGVVIVGLVGFAVWRFFRGRYLERDFELKSEVVSVES